MVELEEMKGREAIDTSFSFFFFFFICMRHALVNRKGPSNDDRDSDDS